MFAPGMPCCFNVFILSAVLNENIFLAIAVSVKLLTALLFFFNFYIQLYSVVSVKEKLGVKFCSFVFVDVFRFLVCLIPHC